MSHLPPSAAGRALFTATDAAAQRSALSARPTVSTPLASCVARYLIDETSGTTVNDSVGAYDLSAGSGVLAARGGAMTPWGRGGYDALPAVGSNDLSVGTTLSGTGPALGDAFTLLAWVRLDREIPPYASYDRFIVGFRKSASTWGAGNYFSAALTINFGELLVGTANTDAGDALLTSTAPRLATGQWYLAAFRRTRGATRDLVLNGVQIATASAADSPLSAIAGSMVIGGNVSAGGASVNQSPLGVVRCVEIHDAALSDAALLAMYRDGMGQ